MLKVRDVLQSKGSRIWSITPGETVYRALEIMAEKNIGAIMVIEKGNLVGVFSERDYARKVILKGKSSKDTRVEELMTRNIYSIDPDRSLEECLALMSKAHCRHMPVIEAGKLVGIVSIGDVVNAIITSQKVAIKDLENYISGGEYASIIE